jgi:hypothetical protein
MKASPSKTVKAAGGKKRSHDEAAGSATGTSQPMSPPRLDPNREWKKSKAKTDDLLALLNSRFIREKEVDMWRAAAGDPYPIEKSEDEIPMFARFAERGLALPASNFLLTPKFGKESDLWVQLGEESVWWKEEISSDVFGKEVCGRLSAPVR